MPIKSPKYMTIESTISKEVPLSKGVYALYGPDKTVVYYGRSNTCLRDKLISHSRGNEAPCTEESWYFNFELSNTPKKREKELIDEYRKENSSLPKCNKRIN